MGSGRKTVFEQIKFTLGIIGSGDPRRKAQDYKHRSVFARPERTCIYIVNSSRSHVSVHTSTIWLENAATGSQEMVDGHRRTICPAAQ